MTSVSPNVLSVLGNETITITGNNFPNPLGKIMIGDAEVELISSSSNTITVKSPQMSPGIYKLSIYVGSLGYAKYSLI